MKTQEIQCIETPLSWRIISTQANDAQDTADKEATQVNHDQANDACEEVVFTITGVIATKFLPPINIHRFVSGSQHPID